MVSLGRSWSCSRQRDGPARLAHAPWHWLRSSPGFLLRLRLNTLYVRLFGVVLHHPGPMTLLPPRLAIGLSAGIVGALLPSHTFPALVLCVLLANIDTPCAVAVLFCLHARVLPCHRLPCRPSSSGEAPFPRLCMLALSCLLKKKKNPASAEDPACPAGAACPAGSAGTAGEGARPAPRTRLCACDAARAGIAYVVRWVASLYLYTVDSDNIR